MRSGPFTGQRYAASLRWLEAHGTECIRMIAFVVRDRVWRTLLPEPASLRTRLRAEGRWTVHARTPLGKAALRWRLEFAPRERGIEASVDMTAERDVITNRSGLVVLLPTATFAGARFIASHGAKTVTRGRLPRSIAPHQPMRDLTGCRIAALEGPTLAIAFEGDEFEMEDQRNWLDPTFKLYSRSLSRPFPYRIRDGARVEQRIRIDVVSECASRRGERSTPARRGRLPALGIATAPGRVPASAPAIEALRELAPAFVLHRTDAKGRDVSRADALAFALGAALRVETFGDGKALTAALLGATPSAVAPYLTRGGTAKALRKHAPAIALTGGTFSDFVLLNRNGVDSSAQRATFALCPTVHARDDRTLIESLDALPAVFAQARSIAAGRPVDAGPCTLRRRLLPRSGRPASRPRSQQGIPYDVDSRHGEPIAAAWLATVIAAASVTGIDSLCAFEAAGARGLVGANESFPVTPALAPGRRAPAHAVLAALGSSPRALLTLYALRSVVGAAFTLGRVASELWLVELTGRARPLPRGVAALGLVARLGRGRNGALWTSADLDRPLNAYGIARVAISRASPRSIGVLARAWCGSS
jgi:D-apionolactonase